MTVIDNEMLWRQFEPAIDMLGDALCDCPFAELQLYNLRHMQEHAAQLRMFLGQQAGKSAE